MHARSSSFLHALIICAALTASVHAFAADSDMTTQTIADLRLQLTNDTREIVQLREQLVAAQKDNDQLRAQLAVKPSMPVQYGVRKALLGPGLVLMLRTTVKEPVVLLATITNPALNTIKRIEVHVPPAAQAEVGAAQGAVIDPGDTITLSNNNYSPIAFTVQ